MPTVSSCLKSVYSLYQSVVVSLRSVFIPVLPSVPKIKRIIANRVPVAPKISLRYVASYFSKDARGT